MPPTGAKDVTLAKVGCGSESWKSSKKWGKNGWKSSKKHLEMGWKKSDCYAWETNSPEFVSAHFRRIRESMSPNSDSQLSNFTPSTTVAGVGGGGDALNLREIAVETGDGIEPAALRHISHGDAFAERCAINDATSFGDAVVIDEVVECLALPIDVDRDVGLVGADGSGKVGERKMWIEVDFVLLHASL